MKFNAIILLLMVLSFSQAAAAQTLHVAPSGTPAGTGEPGKPISLQGALDRAQKDPGITHILLAAGDYTGNFILKPLDQPRHDRPSRLTIQPTPGAKVVLRNSVQITEAQLVPGWMNLYRCNVLPPGEPAMWEHDSRVRYRACATKDSVGVYPGSCFVDETEKALYLSTSDGKSPSGHTVWLSLSPTHSRGLAVYRPDVVLEGLGFADYASRDNMAIQIFSSKVTVKECNFENCEKAVSAWTGTQDIVIDGCRGQDIAQPIYSLGKDIVVRNCVFVKAHDRFLLEVYPQDDCAYQVYAPGAGGTFEGNFCKGYFNGILIKAGISPYIIRHNTIIDSHSGILWSATRPDSDVSYNIISGARAFIHAQDFPERFKLDHNLFWNPKEYGEFEASMQVIRGAGLGKFNVLADPRFMDEASGDYRLRPDSPALGLGSRALKPGEQGRPAGAFGVAALDSADQARPTLSLAFEADSVPFGPSGQYTFEKDPWIGGGTTHISQLSQGEIPMRLVGQGMIKFRLRAFDAAGTIKKMRFIVGTGETVEAPFRDSHLLALPDREGEYAVTCEVENDRGIVSAPARATVRVDRTAPRLMGQPQVMCNDQGVIINLGTSEACFATVFFGESPEALAGQMKSALMIQRFWDANDGGEWVETWSTPRNEHAIAILAPQVKSGAMLYYKIALTDQAGLTSQSPVFNCKVIGQPREIVVSTDGNDHIDSKCFKTLQYAVDRALPGDRIVIEPGVYTQYTCMTHGGTGDDHRVVIEARIPGTVTLDGAKRHTALIHLESAPWVTVRGLRILDFKKAGIYSYRSPETQIDGCVFFNGLGWATGYHTFMFNSPGAVVTRCLTVGSEVGFYFLASPGVTVKNNIASQHMFAAAVYAFSARGTTQMNNSFAFGASNDVYSIEMQHPDELKTFVSDYNNLGTLVGAYGDNYKLEKSDPDLWRRIKAEAFSAKYPIQFFLASKAVVSLNGKRYLTLKDWTQATGQDKHSLFADPGYVNPCANIDRWDWSVKPGSPNLIGGLNMGPIGVVFDQK